MGKHLTEEQRGQLQALLKSGLTQAAMATALGCSQSAISRELKRNQGSWGYYGGEAQSKAVVRRRKASRVPRKMTPELIVVIETKLREEQLSPEQISGRLKASGQVSVSPERIYRHIWKDKGHGGSLFKHLRRKAKKYNKRGGKLAGRGIIPGRVDIDQRPAIVDLRVRIGDWEADTVVGLGHKTAILSMVERVSKFTLLQKLDAVTANATSQAMVSKLRPYRNWVHTITADNGKEFAGHQFVARKLKTEFYFAKPYHAWERGLNENTNGLIRQYFPKGTDFAKLSNKQIERVQDLLNSRPRKTLEYRSPNEVFSKR